MHTLPKQTKMLATTRSTGKYSSGSRHSRSGTPDRIPQTATAFSSFLTCEAICPWNGHFFSVSRENNRAGACRRVGSLIVFLVGWGRSWSRFSANGWAIDEGIEDMSILRGLDAEKLRSKWGNTAKLRCFKLDRKCKKDKPLRSKSSDLAICRDQKIAIEEGLLGI